MNLAVSALSSKSPHLSGCLLRKPRIALIRLFASKTLHDSLCIGWWLYSTGRLAHLLAELVCLIGFSQIVASICSQLLALTFRTCITHYCVGWVYISISAPFRAVLLTFPPSEQILHVTVITVHLSLTDLILNFVKVVLTGGALCILAMIYALLLFCSYPVASFWLVNLVFIAIVLKPDLSPDGM